MSITAQVIDNEMIQMQRESIGKTDGKGVSNWLWEALENGGNLKDDPETLLTAHAFLKRKLEDKGITGEAEQIKYIVRFMEN